MNWQQYDDQRVAAVFAGFSPSRLTWRGVFRPGALLPASIVPGGNLALPVGYGVYELQADANPEWMVGGESPLRRPTLRFDLFIEQGSDGSSHGTQMLADLYAALELREDDGFIAPREGRISGLQEDGEWLVASILLPLILQGDAEVAA